MDSNTQHLCLVVLNTLPITERLSDCSPLWLVCPLCYNKIDYIENGELKDISHERGCAYVIAKEIMEGV